MNITQERFAGANPAIDGRVLKENYAQLAQNCELVNGKLMAALGDKANASVPDTPTFIRFHGEWVSWTEDVDAVPELLNDDKYGRVYWMNGSGRLMHRGFGRETSSSSSSSSSSGSSDSETFGAKEIYNPAPSSAPVAATVPFYEFSGEYPVSGSSSSSSGDTLAAFYPDFGPQGCKDTAVYASSGSSEGNLYEIIFEFPGYANNLETDAGNVGRLIIFPQAKGRLVLSNGMTAKFDFESTATTSPEDIRVYLANKDEYMRLSILSCELYDRDDSYTGNPPDGKVYATRTLPCKFKLKVRADYASYASARNYLVTYADNLGQESPSSDVSNMIYAREGDTVTVSIPKASFSPGVRGSLRKVRLYRTGGSIADNSASFYFVKELSYDIMANMPTTIVFTDDVPDGSLAEEHLNVTNPPEGMFGLVSLNGSLAAAKGKDVYFSEPFLPFNWRGEYNYTVANKIVALAATGQSLFVLTEAEPEIFSGSHPGMMTQNRTSFKQPAVSKHAVTVSEGTVYYASPDGLVSLSEQGGAKLATQNLFTRDQWQAMTPATMRLACHNGNIILFTAAHGTFIFYPGGDFVTHENRAAVTGLYEDVATDTLYLRGSGEWRNDTANRKTLLYRSRVFTTVRPVAFSAARVIQYPASGGTFRLYSVPNGTAAAGTTPRFDPTVRPPNSKLAATVSITGEKAFRLPFMRREMAWFWEVETTGTVSSVDLANSIGEIKAHE